MSAQASPSIGATPRSQQRGAALLILLATLALGAVLLLADRIGGLAADTDRAAITSNALAQARVSLIGYAAKEDNSAGTLPCPDIDGDGSSDAEFGGSNPCKRNIGLLPWRTLALSTDDMRDGNGDCLWYALSPTFRNTIPTMQRGLSQPVVNTDTPGELVIYGTDGLALPSPANPVIALIFAPGAPLAGQMRVAPSATCPGAATAASYLDTGPAPAAIDNATGNGTGTTFVLAVPTDTFNDRSIAITGNDLFRVVARRVLGEIRGSPTGYGLLKYLSKEGHFPYADSDSDRSENAGELLGTAPIYDLQLAADTAQWLDKNDWSANVSYTVDAGRSSVSIALFGITISCNASACN